MEQKNIIIMIPKQVVQTRALSNYAIAAYCAVNVMQAIPCKQLITSRNIYYLLSGSLAATNGTLKKIRSGLQELQDHKLFAFDGEYKDGVAIDFSSREKYKQSSNFILVSLEEINNIFKIDNANPFYMLRYFLVAVGSINYDTKEGHISQQRLAEMAGISPRVLHNYNNILENNNLLYINHPVKLNNTQTKRYGNVYGRPEHKKEIDAYAAKIRKSFSEQRIYIIAIFINTIFYLRIF